MAITQVKKKVHILNNALDVLQFGKYRGMTVEDVLKDDPQYILWAHDNKVAIVAEHLLNYAMEDKRDWSSSYDGWGDYDGPYY